ncbi:MAG TPA: RHS repeat-associated core domain-containing protein, partial [Candidatus Angelobacter sp.]|nr:RHS repeat-associated core domain-containing protein [Candidatus Angelobacter sp.]
GLTVTGGVSSYQSTVAYTRDAGNRVTQVNDSLAGIITRSYDGFDRLLSEATPQGSIGYTYDLAGRRTSMTVNGQSTVSYSYDNADRLTQLSQGSSSVSFSYDDDNRRSSLVLPNGVTVSYDYDQASHVTGISYQLGSTNLGGLTYTYDQLGRRTQVSGSFARTALPANVVSATYDAANQLTNWNGTPVSSDANGNVLSDGTNTFTWDARNQLSSANGTNLSYDGLGRRIQNLQGISFIYDGVNPVQEQSGGAVTANLLAVGIDEIFSRTDASGTFTQLKDALGSTVALADVSGDISAAYTYDPFGTTLVSGQSSSNAFQFTGRENEGNGLYAYRARYYSPAFQRFLSLDPMGYQNDPNPYLYARNNPVNFVDPLGLDPGSYSPGRGGSGNGGNGGPGNGGNGGPGNGGSNGPNGPGNGPGNNNGNNDNNNDGNKNPCAAVHQIGEDTTNAFANIGFGLLLGSLAATGFGAPLAGAILLNSAAVLGGGGAALGGALQLWSSHSCQ